MKPRRPWWLRLIIAANLAYVLYSVVSELLGGEILTAAMTIGALLSLGALLAVAAHRGRVSADYRRLCRELRRRIGAMPPGMCFEVLRDDGMDVFLVRLPGVRRVIRLDTANADAPEPGLNGAVVVELFAVAYPIVYRHIDGASVAYEDDGPRITVLLTRGRVVGVRVSTEELRELVWQLQVASPARGTA